VVAHAVKEVDGVRQTQASADLIDRRRRHLDRHIVNLALAAHQAIESEPALAGEALEIAQWVHQTFAASALVQMAARFAYGPGMLMILARETQDGFAAWRGLDGKLLDALSKPQGQQDSDAIEALRRQIAVIEGKLAANAARLEKEFPDYAALASPKPLKAEDVQKLLGPDEAMVFFLSGGKESQAFAMTRERFEWRTIPLRAEELAVKVDTFRHGLDIEQLTQASKTGTKAQGFSLGDAYDLYIALFSAIEPVIKDKRHLLVVPSGPLTALPFHLLVTQDPGAPVPSNSAGYREAAWLLKRHAISVLPSVTSLKALRHFAKKSTASNRYVAFGNPLLLGPDGKDRRAWNGQRCPKKPLGSTQRAVARTGTQLPGISLLFRDNLADVTEVQKLAALPETTEELCAVARRLGVPESEIWLGERATERNIKRMSEQGRLANYGILHFATHGLVTGQLKGLAEPALVLTPPTEASEADDGLLTASEVAQLKLNADWVVLSACNTAAAGEEGAEALSGLARAFFYAGARALLVSHWPVNSDAAVKLTTKAFAELRANPKIGRAEAMQRSMIDVITHGTDDEVHPAYWAPFFVVGEGAAQ
jgi:CHAT domain-containing protein